MTHTVLVTASVPEPVLEPLAGLDLVVAPAASVWSDEALAALPRAHGMLSSNHLPIGADHLGQAPGLRAVSLVGVGHDHVDLAAAAARGVLVTNTPGVLTDAVADLTIGLLIAVARNIPEAGRAAADGRWSRVAHGTDLRGKTIGIVGYGRIGREVAARARAFKLDVVYYDAADVPADAGARRAASLRELLSVADFVSIHTDLNPSSRHLIGADELAAMKRSAFLVNTARGAVVDEAALCDALADGTIAGAALDVLEREPPDASNPLLAMPNVVVTPHVASATRETRRAMADLAVENLLACLEGRRCACVLNPPA